MAPSSTQTTLLSPAELDYLHTSLSLAPPIRPDGRSSTQFRPLLAETDILPSTNGSARICFADGTEAVAGVKAEVEKLESELLVRQGDVEIGEREDDARGVRRKEGRKGARLRMQGEKAWVETSIEIPGYRDDDALPVFLSAMLNEALLATGELERKLAINGRFHWRLYVDILLLSPPTSYPIPLLSLATHLALLSTRLPALISEGDEDPLFNDDWDAALPLYPQPTQYSTTPQQLPPITLLVAAVGSPPKILFDPSREEVAVADSVLAVSLGTSATLMSGTGGKGGVNASESRVKREFTLLAVRTIDPPARMTGRGVRDEENPATVGIMGEGKEGAKGERKGKGVESKVEREGQKEEGVWRPPRGGMPRGLVAKAVGLCVAEGGVAEEVLAGLEGFIKGGG